MEKGWVSAVTYCMICCSKPGQACQSTFLSLDIKTFDNHATTDAEEEGEERENSLVHCAC